MHERFVDRLTPVLTEGDLVAAWELLDSLEGEELREARVWFARSKRWCSEPGLTWAGEDHSETYETWERANWILSLCAVRLMGPKTAAGRLNWNSHWDYREDEGEAVLVQQLWDADRAWVAEFVEAAGHVSLGGQGRNSNANLSRVLRAAVVHHDLPCPTGRTFLKCWWAGTGEHATLTDVLASDPLMPDLLPLYLGAGDCGELPALPEVVAELVDQGVVDRAAVLDRVLEVLTTAQRPKSQAVLVRILAALELQPAEIPGGLTYLLGVLATGHSSVLPVLLPLALASIEDADGLAELTQVMVARPEKGPRNALLVALKAPPMAASVGTPAVVAALRSLAVTEDVAFAAKVQKVLAVVAPDDDEVPEVIGHPTMGLWDLSPIGDPGPIRPPDMWGRLRPGWDEALDKRYPYADRIEPGLVGATLSAMADGTFADGAPLRAAVTKLLTAQCLSTTWLCRTFEDLFLAGGLRQAWPVALDLVDDVCAATTRPPGLADLLRLLRRYAAEVPDRYDVQPGLAALALSPGTSKAQSEARRLVATLTRLPEDESLAVLADRAHAPELPSPSGLWGALTAPEVPLPSEVRVGDGDDPILGAGRDLAALRELLSQDFNGYAQSFQDICYWPPGYGQLSSTTGLTEPDRVLGATLMAIRRYGAAEVRAALTGIERDYQPVDVVLAIDCWIAEVLDRATFWRVSAGPLVAEWDLKQRWRDEGHEHEVVHAKHLALPPFVERLRHPGELVVPGELASPIERFTFLRAAELLLLEDAPFLAAPDWADGTLDVETFLARLDEAAARPGMVVGPLDLVQALHRLRPTDPATATAVPPGLRTAAAYTDPEGQDSWDASALVSHWLAKGGLPTLEVEVAGEKWATPTVTPVPFTRLAALPAELAEDPWCPGPIPAVVRMLPRWPDRVTAEAFGALALDDPRHFPGLVAGPFGLPLHDRLLALGSPYDTDDSFKAHSLLIDFVVRGRLDPAMAAAAAVGRHEAGTLKLADLVKTLRRLFPLAFRGVWPSSLAIVDALCGVKRKPTQLPDLLRLLTAHAHEVPADVAQDVPAKLVALAESRGSTKSHEAARHLVEALRATGSR